MAHNQFELLKQRRFLPFFRQEPFEQQLHANGIDFGDAQAITHR